MSCDVHIIVNDLLNGCAINNKLLTTEIAISVVLGISKAFGRLNHWVLIKLIDRGIVLIIIRFFAYWYGSAQFCIRWDSTL